MGKANDVNPTPAPNLGGETVPGSDATTTKETPAVGAAPEKRASREEHIDHVNSIADEGDGKKDILPETERDYAGGQAKKTDPEEIALVRKLDWRVMVSGGLPQHDEMTVMR